MNITATGPEYRLFIARGDFCESEAFFLGQWAWSWLVGGGGEQYLFAPSLPTGELLPVEGDMESTRRIPSLQPICLSASPCWDLKD